MAAGQLQDETFARVLVSSPSAHRARAVALPSPRSRAVPRGGRFLSGGSIAGLQTNGWRRVCLRAASLVLCFTLAGCAGTAAKVDRSWYKPWTWRADQTADARKTAGAKNAAQSALAANSAATVRAAGERVAATGAALSARTNREPATDLAEKFNREASALLPPPTVDELKQLQSIVAGLLSTNAQERAAATLLLDARDKQLAELQRMTGELREKLSAAEESHASAVTRLQDAYVGERTIADKWRQEQAKTWGRRILDLLGTGGLVALACTGVVGLPMAGRLFGWFSRVMPSSSALTGVVSATGFNHVVAGVESATAAIREKDPQLAARVLDLLRIERAPDDDALIDHHRTAVRRRKAAKLPSPAVA